MVEGEDASWYLFVEELSGVFLDVSFVQVCGQTHQTDLWETEVRQLDVSHGGDEKTAAENIRGLSSNLVTPFSL